MEPLLAQLRTLPARFAALSAGGKRLALAALAILVLGGVAALGVSKVEPYQYAFTKLTPEDATASAEALKAASIPFRVDAGGEAIAVPADKVHDARLLLASQGLPRAGGVGFELFDKSELGVSEFTQRVNLQRAIEGELARTIQSLAKVRSARVHVTIPKRGLFADEERKASAAVVVHLQPGRSLDENEVGGIRHLVASAVPELSPDNITLVDGDGAMLGAADKSGLAGEQKLERDLERRIVEMLEPAVGRGGVVAKVTATMDRAEEDTRTSTYDPEKAAVKSERKHSAQSQTVDGEQGAVTGAAANNPTQPTAAPGNPRGRTENKNDSDEDRTFEVSGVVQHRVEHEPRLTRLSVAVIVDSPEKDPRSDEDVKRLTELAKHAVGFDEDRGDKLQLSSVAFHERAGDPAAADGVPPPASSPAWLIPAVVGGGVLLALAALAVFVLRGRKRGGDDATALVRAGVNGVNGAGASAIAPGTIGPDGVTIGVTASAGDGGTVENKPLTLHEKARLLALKDPLRAAQVIDLWLREDGAAGANALGAANASTSPRALEASRG